MKDPAILFYSADFLNGVSDLTMEERGQFITMLCLQHIKGEVSEKTIRLTLGSVSVDVLEKFRVNENGNYVNDRMAEEIEKRAKFSDSRRKNGKNGGRPAVKDQNDEKIEEIEHINNHKVKKQKPYGYAKNNHIENVNENENINENINTKGSGKNFLDNLPETYTAAELLATDEVFMEQLAMKQHIDPEKLTHMLVQFDLSKEEAGEQYQESDLKKLKAGFQKWVNSWMYTERKEKKHGHNGHSHNDDFKITKEMYD